MVQTGDLISSLFCFVVDKKIFFDRISFDFVFLLNNYYSMEKNIFKMLSPEQRLLLTIHFYDKFEIARLKKLVEKGFPLSASVLTAVVCLGLNRCHIKDFVKSAVVIENDVFEWIRVYFDSQELAEILPLLEDRLPDSYLSIEECAEYKLWKTMLKRGFFDYVAHCAPEVLEQDGSELAYGALLRVDFEHYADDAFAKGYYSALINAQDGWKYLIERGLIKRVLDVVRKTGIVSEDKVSAYCIEKGFVDELYDAKYYDELLTHGEFDVFVKKHGLVSEFLDKYPEQVDWEDLWNVHHRSHDYLISQAFKHSDVQKCHNFLRKHAGFWGQLRLLIRG